MEYTDWYEHDVKPVRIGVYEIQDQLSVNKIARCFAHFDGQYFGYAVWSDDGMIDLEVLHSDDFYNRHHATTWTNKERWRGVKEES
jgi:hypothetical protein